MLAIKHVLWIHNLGHFCDHFSSYESEIQFEKGRTNHFTTQMKAWERRLVWISIVAVAFQYVYNRVYYEYDELFYVLGRKASRFLPTFDHQDPPPRLNYSSPKLEAWCAHPEKRDMADTVPPNSPPHIKDLQDVAHADVFHVNPTGFFSLSRWNAPVGVLHPSAIIAGIVNEGGTLVHGTIFNGVGRIYSPSYRQMNGIGYVIDETHPMEVLDQKRSLDLAYGDVLDAFDVYLERWNDGRPIFLSGHSQGSYHLLRLLKDRFEKDTKLRRQLVAAYLVGAGIHHNDLGNFEVCKTANQTGCVISYNVFIEPGGDPTKFLLSKTPEKLVCVNPISWTMDENFVEAHENKGSRPIRPWKLIPSFFEPSSVVSELEHGAFYAQCRNGVVWTNEPPMSGFRTGIFPGRNYHGVESSMFWANTRANAADRLRHFLEQISNEP